MDTRADKSDGGSEETPRDDPGAQPPGAKKMLNLVNEASKFFVDEPQFEEFVEANHMNNVKSNYSVVAVMGGQSGGKSTLLNLLFGTSFAVLDSQVRRSATTKGIWLAHSKYSNDTLVMDLEGTDSDEKDEAAVETFARQASLFALALAEVLIINVWAHDVGKRKAQNLLVLETIFEVNLSLFQKNNDNKTVLLFTIRDHIERKNPMSVLRQSIMKNINNIWDKISKPEYFKDKKVDDVFKIEFMGLRHYDLQHEAFLEDARSLRERFTNPELENSFFNSDIHYRKSQDVPFPMFRDYTSQLWETITEFEELNIVSQKESLIDRLCEKHMNASYETSQDKTREITQQIEHAIVEGFGAKMGDILKEATSQYDKVVFQSEQEQKNGVGPLHAIKNKRRSQLIEKIGKDFQLLFDRQMQHARSVAKKHFEELLEEGLPSDGSAASDYMLLAQSCKVNALRKFDDIQEASSIAGTFSWSTALHVSGLEEDIAKHIELTRKAQLECLNKEVEKRLKGQFAPEIAAIAKKADGNLWSKVHEAREKATESINSLLNKKLPGLDCTEKEIQKNHEENAIVILRIIREKMIEQINFIDQILLKRFDKMFRYDEEGMPREWNSSIEYRELFRTARNEAFGLLDVYSRFQNNAGEEESETKWRDMDEVDKMFIKPDLFEEIKTKFEQTTTGALREVENQIGRMKTEIPVWLVVLLIALGWNEMSSVMYSPVYFIMCCILACIVYVIYRLNLAGPVTAVLKEAMKKATELMHNAINGPKKEAEDVPFMSLNSNSSRRMSDPVISDSSVMNKQKKIHRRFKTQPNLSQTQLDELSGLANSDKSE